MSGWTFEAKVDMHNLENELARWMSISSALESIGELIKEDVVTNIEHLHIIDTGELRDSITSEMKGDDTVSVHDGAPLSGVPHGVYNEFGTSRMAARPHFIPACDKFGEIAYREFRRVLNK